MESSRVDCGDNLNGAVSRYSGREMGMRDNHGSI